MTAAGGARGTGRAVVDGVLRHVSASQTKTYQMCARRWYFEKVMGLTTPGTRSQILGQQVHLEAQNYYELGRQPTFKSLQLALPALPPRSPSLLIESALEAPALYAADNVQFVGFIDMLEPPGEKPVVRILDFKTTSNLDYAKTPEELIEDVQMGAYGYWAHLKYPDAQVLDLAHCYLTTKGKPEFRIVEATCEFDAAEDVWRTIRETVVSMQATAAAPNFEAVTPNWSSCDAFGGCPFRDRCGAKAGVSKSVRTLLSERKPTMSLSQKLAAPAPKAPAAPTPPTATVPGALYLYVDAVPLKGEAPYVLLDDLIAQRNATIAQNFGVGDVRLVPYSDGIKALAADFAANPPSGVVFALSSSLTNPIIEALVPIATKYTRGTR
jgi:hypothetical protein